MHNTRYNATQGAAGGLDLLSFGQYSRLAGAFGARVDQGSTAYQVGFWATGAFLAVRGGIALGSRLLAANASATMFRSDANLLLPVLGSASQPNPEEYVSIMIQLHRVPESMSSSGRTRSPIRRQLAGLGQ
jgi:hypothetical protein